MNYYRVLENENKFECTECNKKLSGANKNNIIRHYRLVHFKEIVLAKKRGNNVCKLSTDQPPKQIKCKYSVDPPPKQSNKVSVNINIDKNDFLKCCVGLVAVRNMPLEIFDDREYFKTLISPFEDAFNTDLNSRNILKVLESSSTKIQDNIKLKVKNEMVSLKLDIATIMYRSMLGISVQYIKNSKICISTLGMIPLQKIQKAKYLKDEILNCLRTYDIELNQIYSTTTDNGANVIDVIKIQQELQVDQLMEEDETTDENYIIDENILTSLTGILPVGRCAAYTIQLAAYDVIKNLEPQIGECRKVIKKLRNLVRAGGLDIQMQVPDNTTRWNAVYEMIKSLQNLKDFIDSEFFDSTNIRNNINWDFVSDFVTSFAPLAKCAKQLQREQYILGDFYRDWLTCEIELEELASPSALLLHLAMQNRKQMLLENDAFVAALYLDPRFNFVTSAVMSEEQKTRAMTHLVNTFNIMQKLESSKSQTEYLLESPKNDLEECKEQPTTSSAAYAKLAQRIMSSAANAPRSAETQNFKQKLMLLSNTNMVSLDTDILEYWNTTPLDEDIFKVMNVALAVPASQVSVEWAFSALALTLTKLRSELDNTTLNNLFITKLNFSEINHNNIKLDFSDEDDFN